MECHSNFLKTALAFYDILTNYFIGTLFCNATQSHRYGL